MMWAVVQLRKICCYVISKHAVVLCSADVLVVRQACNLNLMGTLTGHTHKQGIPCSVHVVLVSDARLFQRLKYDAKGYRCRN